MTTNNEIMQAVSRGAALLDERRPGWDKDINLYTLNMADGFRCILAQVFDTDFAAGTTALGLIMHEVDPHDTVTHGFTLSEAPPRRDWDQLQQSWASLILSRRQSA